MTLRYNKLVLIQLCILAVFSLNCKEEPENTKQNGAVSSDLTPNIAYVGDDECALCHAEIYRTFKQTGMGRSFYLPEPDNIIEDYSDNNHVYDPKSNFHYEMIRDGDDFFQIEYRLDQEGNRTHELKRKIDYIVGSGNHNRTYIYERNGFLFEMPVTWYSEKNIWDLSPGYHHLNLRFSRPIVPECINCHNSYSEHVRFSENKYTDVPEGIGCERCHGPGEQHVEFRSNIPFSETKGIELDSTIINPKHLTATQQMDVCRQCHLQGEIRVLREGKTETDFKPGMHLSEVKSVYVRDGLASGDFRIASHGARLSLSACFTQSNGGMVCTTCHDPHKPVQWLERSHFNSTCQECHAVATLSETPETEHEKDSDCVACHMPQGGTSDILHVNFTDHWIRKNVERLTEEESETLFSETDAVLTLKSFFDETDRAAEIRLGIAYVTYYEAKHENPAYIEKALAHLEPALLKTPEHRDGLYNLGKAYYHIGRNPEALTTFETLAKLAPQDALAHFQLGRVLERLGRLPEAAEALQTSIHIFPENPIALNNLGNVYAELGQLQKALQYYQASIDAQPGYELAHNNLGDLYTYNLGDTTAGEKHLQKALTLDPDFVTAHHNLGNLYLTQGKLEKAEEQFQKAVEIDAQFIPAYGNLALLHLQKNENKEAAKYLRKLLAVDPSDQKARMLLNQIENNM